METPGYHRLQGYILLCFGVLTGFFHSLQFVNSHEAGLLVAGTDDGCVRVWTGWEEKPRLVTGWSILPELVPQSLAGSRVSCGLQLTWAQHTQIMIGAGDAKCIRLWDCFKELKIGDFPTQSDSCVTCLHMDKGILAVSFGDGQIKLFDHRAPPSTAKIMAVREHQQMILALKLQENGKLVSGCTDGVVKVNTSFFIECLMNLVSICLRFGISEDSQVYLLLKLISQQLVLIFINLLHCLEFGQPHRISRCTPFMKEGY